MMVMKNQSVLLFISLWMSFLSVGLCYNLKSVSDTNATTRAQQTLQGMFEYYWKQDPINKKVFFFFACGQVGEQGVFYPYECSCGNTPYPCLNCYRWWSGVALESIATYGIYMNTKNHSSVADMTFDHSPYNSDWDPKNSFIDDFLWYGITYLRVYEWLKDPKWLQRSIALYDWSMEYGLQEPCGGIYWCYDVTRSYKDNIQLVQAIHLSAKLAYTLPKETKYLKAAQKLWDWFFSFNNGRGIVTEQNILATGLVPERCCNATSDPYTRCHVSPINGTAYNQGIFLSGAAYLYLLTGNQSYIDAANRVLKAVIANYTVDGILRDESRSYQSYQYSCIAGGDPGGDWYSFNGIFMLHLGYYVEVLSERKGSLSADMLNLINDFVQKTSDSAWKNSASWPPFNASSNGCDNDPPSPHKKNTTSPKFHWWWYKDAQYQQTPPDPRYYFHKFQVRCYSIGNSTQIWSGKLKSELECTQLCNKYKNCSKYLFQTDLSEVSNANCWIWSYNRSNHICNITDYNWNIGIKRPIGATCAGKCGSKEPQKLDNDSVCYCDADCSKHLDCCIDYAEICRPNVPISCKGHCADTITEVLAQPLIGGGYCWCDYACNPSFTDNNSDSSCCADYPQQCLKIKMPPCLDARTQGSALNLFLGHMSVTNAMKTLE